MRGFKLPTIFSSHSNLKWEEIKYRKMENAAYSHEVIEMDPPQARNAPATHYNVCATKPQSVKPDGSNGHSQHYCDVSKCCNKNQPEKESPWHSSKSTFLLMFLVGFLVWAVLYFGVFNNI